MRCRTPAPGFTSWLLSLLTILTAFLAVGCGNNTDTTTTPKGGTDLDAASSAPLTTLASDAMAPLATTISADAGPAPVANADPDDRERPECGGADVDLVAVLANKRCRTRPDASPNATGWASTVKVALTASPEKVAPGGRVELTLELTNTGAAAVPLYFAGDLTLSAAVTDGKGARIAPPSGPAPKNPEPRCLQEASCRNPTSHVLLAPGGKARAKLTWEASKVAWPKTGPTACCAMHVDAVATGPLAAGAYKVKVPLPFEAAQGNPADPEIVVKVAK
jgi:hypothetical protein